MKMNKLKPTNENMKIVEATEDQIDKFCQEYSVRLDPRQPKTFAFEVGKDFVESDENVIMLMAYMADLVLAENVEFNA